MTNDPPRVPVRVAVAMSEAGTVRLAVADSNWIQEDHCGDFKDDFDWGTLPAHYLRRIGGAPRKGDSHGLKT